MNLANVVLLSSGALLVGMLAMVELGRRLGARHARGEPSSLGAGTKSVEAALFALLGLLVAFMFYGAGERFDARRRLVVEEANAIGTAYLRLDALPVEVQPALREDFRAYADARIDAYARLPDLAEARAHLDRATQLQRAIWSRAVRGCQLAIAHPSACVVVLPSLTVMIDITTTRTMATRMHPPAVLFGFLFALALYASLIAGFDSAVSPRRPWLHMGGFVVMLALTIYLTLDLEHPRFGYLQVSDFDAVLREVRGLMNERS